jgi:hypothetical protein
MALRIQKYKIVLFDITPKMSEGRLVVTCLDILRVEMVKIIDVSDELTVIFSESK